MGRSTARPPSPRQLAPALGLVAAGGAAGFGLGKAGMWENDGDIWGNGGKISGHLSMYPLHLMEKHMWEKYGEHV